MPSHEAVMVTHLIVFNVSIFSSTECDCEECALLAPGRAKACLTMIPARNTELPAGLYTQCSLICKFDVQDLSKAYVYTSSPALVDS